MTEELSDEEFQILKSKLTENVKQYLTIDEEIKALNKAVRERRKRKTEFSNIILDCMKKIDIHHMNIKDGRLVKDTSIRNFKSNGDYNDSYINEPLVEVK